jgi:hypothetical protein
VTLILHHAADIGMVVATRLHWPLEHAFQSFVNLVRPQEFVRGNNCIDLKTKLVKLVGPNGVVHDVALGSEGAWIGGIELECMITRFSPRFRTFTTRRVSEGFRAIPSRFEL